MFLEIRNVGLEDVKRCENRVANDELAERANKKGTENKILLSMSYMFSTTSYKIMDKISGKSRTRFGRSDLVFFVFNKPLLG